METNPNLKLSAWVSAATLVLIAGTGCSNQSAPPAATRTPAPQGSTGALDRTVLPIPEPNYPLATELDARNAKAPPRFDVKAPKGAPNVVIFLIDDIGFGHT